jgi:hypothetical protein
VVNDSRLPRNSILADVTLPWIDVSNTRSYRSADEVTNEVHTKSDQDNLQEVEARLEGSSYSFIGEKDSSKEEDVYHIDSESEQDINDTNDLYYTVDCDEERRRNAANATRRLEA